MKFQEMFRGFAILIFSLSLTISIFPSAAHTYHTSLTRMDYNQKDKLIEITIQLFTHDLAPVLSKFARKSIDLENSTDTDEILLKYLNENFILKDEKDVSRKLIWIGKEQKADLIYVYVEVPFEGDSKNLQLQNTVFFESFAEQTNLVAFHNGERKTDLFYKAGDKFKFIAKSNLTVQ